MGRFTDLFAYPKTFRSVQVCDQTAIRSSLAADQGCDGEFELRKKLRVLWSFTTLGIDLIHSNALRETPENHRTNLHSLLTPCTMGV